MACGLPVAAYPVTGPVDVLADGGAGAMNEDLREACLDALKIDRGHARAWAETVFVARRIGAIRIALETVAARCGRLGAGHGLMYLRSPVFTANSMNSPG